MNVTDKINLAIAIGTGLAALGSLIAALIASKAARNAELSALNTAREEKDRWLAGVLLSMANQCNECVSTTGIVLPTKENVSRLITILYNAISLIKRERERGNRNDQYENLWIFLHSSIWVEIKERHTLLKLDGLDEQTKNDLPGQYDYVHRNLTELR